VAVFFHEVKSVFQSQGKTASSFSLTGMKSKIFGNDTPEQREQKIKQLEEQIQQSEVELRRVGEETQYVFIYTTIRVTYCVSSPTLLSSTSDITIHLHNY
jgi:hypothetical protein